MIEVDNIIIMAAGMSTRLAPLSYEKPKALLEIEGELLIERQIEQALEAGIDKIIIVVGYLKEQFKYLEEKYGVILVENPYYQVRNNHSSLYVVREYLGNTYISCADYYFKSNPFQKYVERPYYAASFKKGETDEWCITADANDRITGVTIGGRDAWVMQGEVLFDQRFSKQLLPLLEETFHSNEKMQAYWEDLYVEHIMDMILYEKKNINDNVMEFDSFEELRSQIPQYRECSGSNIMHFIAEHLDCKECELENISPFKNGNVVYGITFEYKGNFYQYYYDTKEIERYGAK